MEHNFKVGDKVLIDNFTYGVIKEPENSAQVKEGHLIVKIPHQPKASISGGRFLIKISRLTIHNELEFLQEMPVMGRHSSDGKITNK